MTHLLRLASIAWLLSAPVAASEPTALTLPPAEADTAVLAAVVRDSGVEREVPKPGWSEYVPVILTAAFRWAWDRLRPLGSLFHVAPGAAAMMATAFVGLVLLILLGLAARLLVRRWRFRLTPGDPASPAAQPSPPPRADAADWLRELDLRLEAGDVAGALEALWWFLARSVSMDEIQASWTSGELLARARRHELRPFAVQLDRLRYGPRDPAATDVRDLALRLERALA